MAKMLQFTAFAWRGVVEGEERPAANTVRSVNKCWGMSQQDVQMN